jgi:arginine-tRNA-protein transferase
VQSNVESVMVEFRSGMELKIVSVVDIVNDGISAVYTFYDAHDKSASFGTFNIMWLIDWCRDLGLPYLYLGYWIADSRKMAYKQKFVPQEGLIDGEWQTLMIPANHPPAPL